MVKRELSQSPATLELGKFTPCTKSHGDVGYYSNGQCKECSREYSRAHHARVKARRGSPKPGDRFSGICKRGHDMAITGRTASRGCYECSADRQRASRLGNGPGKATYPVVGTTYICRRGHPAVHQGKGSTGCTECRKDLRLLREATPQFKAVQKVRYEQWCAANPEKAKLATRRWQLANPDNMQVSRSKRLAAKRGAAGQLLASEWAAIKKKYKNRCADCGQKPPKGQTLQQDHVVPLQGKDVSGPHYAFNIVPRCLRCNVRKTNKVLPGTQHTLFDKMKC